MLTRDEILKAEDLKTEKLHIPEWGGDVYVKTMNGLERERWEEVAAKGDKGKVTYGTVRAYLAYVCLVDDKGKRIFTIKDVDALNKKSCKALDLIFDVAKNLNHLGDKDVEELVKNSETGLSDDSTTD